jgi:hypothetical protein
VKRWQKQKLTSTHWLRPTLSITRWCVLAIETEVLMIETASQPGVLAKIADRLAQAKVNIEYAYLAGGRGVEKGLIVLRPSDVEKAKRALQDL